MVAAAFYPGPQRPMLAAQLRLASEVSHQVVFDYLRERGFVDLRQSHFDLFRFPGPHGLTPTQLAAHVGLSKQALNPLINELESLGYLTRVNDQMDRRIRILQLTARGLDLVTTIRDALDSLEARALARLGAKRYQHLVEAIAEIRTFTEPNHSARI